MVIVILLLLSLFFISVPYQRIVLPSESCWSSLCLCVDAIVNLRGALAVVAKDGAKGLLGTTTVPSEEDLDCLQEIVKPWRIIHREFQRLQSAGPTLHLALSSLVEVGSMSQSKSFASSGRFAQDFVKAFESNLLARVPNFGRNDWMAINLGNVLNPNYKGALLHFGDDKVSYDRTMGFIKELCRGRNQGSDLRPSSEPSRPPLDGDKASRLQSKTALPRKSCGKSPSKQSSTENGPTTTKVQVKKKSNPQKSPTVGKSNNTKVQVEKVRS